ncbi:M48 family metallopeptidase [Aestuariibacter sp. AA17]|uniref:M48 family metallopeptidase n=1 Tax=Fluctibacter corallii TaxID=2984329 RepID=A0ABT3A927_9ALTE|nr:M48 family metallopeptidase [Aestuariibacter sp. AA17]MCV2885188.1 M48 family metallopeptidase [Aestuariibacter sp. AA17]
MCATLFKVDSAMCSVVDVSLHERYLQIDTDEEVQLYEHQQLTVSPRLGRLDREVLLPSGDKLVIKQQAAINEWLDCHIHSRVDKLERNPIAIFSSLLLVPLMLFIVFKFIVPMIGQAVALATPHAFAEYASKHTLNVLDYGVLAPSTLPNSIQTELGRHLHTQLQRVENPDVTYQVLFRQGNALGPNAFALPDGTIIFTDELIKLVDQETRLLDAILLHELGHVAHQHSLRYMAEVLSTTLLLEYILGDMGGVIELFFGVSHTVIQNQYSQALETEADNFALSNLHKIGLDSNDFADAFEALASISKDEGELENLLSTHPRLKERIANARTYSKSPQ